MGSAQALIASGLDAEEGVAIAGFGKGEMNNVQRERGKSYP